MTTRTTDKDLEQLLGYLIETLKNDDFRIGHDYGRVRLENKSGSLDISPSLTRGELEQYIRAMIKGAELLIK